MKLLRNYILGTVTVLTIIMFSACGGSPIEHGTQYTLSGSDGSDTAEIRATQLVIEKRLNNFGLEGDFEISAQDNTITVRVREGAIQDSVRFRRLLQSSGGLKFRAMYSLAEISPTLDTVHKTFLRVTNVDSADRPTSGLAAYFAGVEYTYANPSAPLIAYVRAEDTAALMAIFRHDSIVPLLPADLVFHFGKGEYLETHGPTLSLFACKESRNDVMNGNSIASAVLVENEDSYEISIQFDPVGAIAFTNITRANVGRSLAIEVNNFVCSYPNVNQEITGGITTVTGNFTEEEAEDLVRLLNSGSPPVTFRITGESKF